MRVVTALMKHETNTFSPVPTPLERFARGGTTLPLGRDGFKPIARDVIECAGVGVCTSDYGQLKFERVRRPIFPLDQEATP